MPVGTNPKLLGGRISHKALTWVFASSAANVFWLHGWLRLVTAQSGTGTVDASAWKGYPPKIVIGSRSISRSRPPMPGDGPSSSEGKAQVTISPVRRPGPGSRV